MKLRQFKGGARPYVAEPLIEGPLDAWGYSSERRASMEDHMTRRRRSGYVFRPTTDDWHATWPGGLVSIISFLNDDGSARLSIGGTDDTFMEIDLPSHDAARRMVLALPLIISRHDLSCLGFKWG